MPPSSRLVDDSSSRAVSMPPQHTTKCSAPTVSSWPSMSLAVTQSMASPCGLATIPVTLAWSTTLMLLRVSRVSRESSAKFGLGLNCEYTVERSRLSKAGAVGRTLGHRGSPGSPNVSMARIASARLKYGCSSAGVSGQPLSATHDLAVKSRPWRGSACPAQRVVAPPRVRNRRVWMPALARPTTSERNRFCERSSNRRPPPSRTMTWTPLRASSVATVIPAAPPPTTQTSARSSRGSAAAMSVSTQGVPQGRMPWR